MKVGTYMANRRPPQDRGGGNRRRPPQVEDYEYGRVYMEQPRPPRPPRRRVPHPAAPPRPQRMKAPRRRAMSTSAKAVIGLFFGFVVAYMALRAYGFFTQDVDMMTLRLGNMEMQQSIPGMIVRYEEVFHANRDGRVVFAVQEFDRVREGVAVASIQDIEAVHRNEQERARLQQEIMNVHSMRHATPADPLIERVNANLRNIMSRNMHHHMQSNLSDKYALLDTLTQITRNRNDMIIEESLHMRNELSRRHGVLTAQRELSSDYLYASHSGIMSTVIDGYEERFTPNNMRTLNREEVRTIVPHEALIPGREVEAGDDVFKIVGNTWYVVAHFPNEIARTFTVDTERQFFLENAVTGRFERMPMRISYKSDGGHTHTLVILRSTRNVIEFLNQRNVNIRVTDNVQSGFTVPTSAIATRRFFRIPLSHIHEGAGDDNYFINHRRDDVFQIKPIHISRRDGTYAYISEDSLLLFPGDILNPVDIVDVLHIVSEADIGIERGVYVTTLNYASFRVLDIDLEQLETGGPILIDPSRNTNIRQFDTIAIDAAMVRQGQVVR
ncbi:MAG: hypothetical protein FWF78_08935 [Defluviitaleaceae bacterium]|nr:hypothetical protein [Defluviitaleaceae bacterium]